MTPSRIWSGKTTGWGKGIGSLKLKKGVSIHTIIFVLIFTQSYAYVRPFRLSRNFFSHNRESFFLNHIIIFIFTYHAGRQSQFYFQLHAMAQLSMDKIAPFTHSYTLMGAFLYMALQALSLYGPADRADMTFYIMLV